MLSKLCRSKNIDLRALADAYEMSGGYIKNVALRAAFLAAAENKPVDMNVLRRAAALELEDQGKLVTNTLWRDSGQDEWVARIACSPSEIPYQRSSSTHASHLRVSSP